MSTGTPELAAFSLPDLLERHAGEPWIEFFRVPALSLGIYTLEVGANDEQQPHHEDEIYVVLEGRGVLRVGATDVPAEPGGVLFVAGEAEHRFHSITERLRLLVFFAPAETC